jgi:tetratricopeptide (TPR) repeat protein
VLRIGSISAQPASSRHRPKHAHIVGNIQSFSLARHFDRWMAEQAEASLNRCLQINPRFAAAHNNLGELYRERNELERAAEHYRKEKAILWLGQEMPTWRLSYLRPGEQMFQFFGIQKIIEVLQNIFSCK